MSVKRSNLVVWIFGNKKFTARLKMLIKETLICVIWVTIWISSFICNWLKKKWLLRIHPSAAELKYRILIGWYHSSRSLLIHICTNDLNDVIKITAKGNNISTQVAYIRTCRFVGTTWHICLYEQLDKACEMCGLKLCLRIVAKDFLNILDLSNIIKKWKRSTSLCRPCSFFDFFSVGFYFTNLQINQQQAIELDKETDEFFKRYSRNVEQ